MSDTISRQAAFEALDGKIEITGRTNAEAVKGYVRLVKDRLERLPSAQPEIIHCRDCKHWQSEEYIGNNNVNTPNIASLPCKNWLTGGDWYCGSAERKDI